MRVIEKEIVIEATSENVWRVFADPGVTKQLGGEYVTDWKVCSSFGWKGNDGILYTRGTILALEPGKLLKHNLVDLNNENIIISVITYEFEKNGNATTLFVKEAIMMYEMDDNQLMEVNEGWDVALLSVKQAAEKL